MNFKTPTLSKSLAVILLILVSNLIVTTSSFAQDEILPSLSNNLPSNGEMMSDVSPDFDTRAVSELEEKLKQALESGNTSAANQIRTELQRIAPPSETFIPTPDNSIVFDNSRSGQVETDWAPGTSAVSNGELNADLSQYHRQIEMKMGEDGNIYVAVNRAPNGSNWKSKIEVYRSSNGGKSWVNCGWFASMTNYTYSIAMTIESRVNSIPDSTRINIFYTGSANSSNTAAKLYFGTFRRDGTGSYFAHVADPSSYYTFHSLSAVSDGAFWTSATYFGVVACESDLTVSANTRTRFFRTTNWGGSFTSADLLTNNVDYYPSAQFMNGTTDEVWIALERRISLVEKQVRLIKTPWSVSSSFSTSNVTSGLYIYEKPCLAIKQNNPADSAVITCTRSLRPVYHFTTNAGTSWTINHSLSTSASANKSYTWCSSTPNGPSPFSFIFATNDGQEISVRKGAAGRLELAIHYMVNSYPFSTSVSPVCVTRETIEGSLSAIAFAGENAMNSYVDSEGHKLLSVKVALQGFYNASTNCMDRMDAVTICVKSNTAPYLTVDSISCLLDPVTMLTTSSYGSVTPLKMTELQTNNSYYIVVKHRNSIETWSSIWIPSYLDTISYDFTSNANKAFGNNLLQVDNSPATFALYGGDVNQDGTIDGTDLSLIDNDINNFETGYRSTDINGDLFIDATDAAVADNNANLFVSIIKP